MEGVYSIIPSAFTYPRSKSKDTPTFVKVFTAKPKIRAYVEEKGKEGKITYTIIKNGPFTEMRKSNYR